MICDSFTVCESEMIKIKVNKTINGSRGEQLNGVRCVSSNRIVSVAAYRKKIKYKQKYIYIQHSMLWDKTTFRWNLNYRHFTEFKPFSCRYTQKKTTKCMRCVFIFRTPRGSIYLSNHPLGPSIVVWSFY